MASAFSAWLSQQAGGVITSLGLARVAATAGIPVAWAIGAALLLQVHHPHPPPDQEKASWTIDEGTSSAT